MPLPIVRRLRRRLHTLTRILDLLEPHMAADRDLITALAQAIPAIAAGVDNLADDRDQWRQRALAAEGREATDETDDLASLGPLREGLAAIQAQLAATAGEQDSAPVPLEDVPAVIGAAPAAADEPGTGTAAEAVDEADPGAGAAPDRQA